QPPHLPGPERGREPDERDGAGQPEHAPGDVARESGLAPASLACVEVPPQLEGPAQEKRRPRSYPQNGLSVLPRAGRRARSPKRAASRRPEDEPVPPERPRSRERRVGGVARPERRGEEVREGCGHEAEPD